MPSVTFHSAPIPAHIGNKMVTMALRTNILIEFPLSSHHPHLPSFFPHLAFGENGGLGLLGQAFILFLAASSAFCKSFSPCSAALSACLVASKASPVPSTGSPGRKPAASKAI